MPEIAERALHTRIARSVEAIRRSFIDNLFYVTGCTLESATTQDLYSALAFTIRDRMLGRMIAADDFYKRRGAKTVAYLSAEFLIGPQLANNILSLQLGDNTREAMSDLGLDLEAILEAEQEPGLGNGGLGRLAACYMDSMATLEIPATGYGIRYEYGIFEQAIKDGWQVEVADAWLRNGYPWELPRQHRYPVRFGGHVEHFVDGERCRRVRWVPDSTIYGIAYDTPILGYGVYNVNRLRLWKSEARESFDLQAFNTGDYYGAVNDMVTAQNITKVLYPNDEPEVGRALRLRQQYFFVSCSLQDMIRITLRDLGGIEHFAEQFVVQLNDTHPAIGIAEFMRLLVDEHRMDWDEAWNLTRRSFAYTNHTLLPEALETWPSELLKHTVLKDFHDMWPEKFQNKTNGVTPRRFVSLANPPLAALLDETIGPDWPNNMEQLVCLEDRVADSAFRERWRRIKRLAKERLSNRIHRFCNVSLDPDSIFDVQVKRIHEYKRQHLNVLHMVCLYHRLKQNPSMDVTPRTFVFGGKAAPGYRMAKIIIKLINSVADVINRDVKVNKVLRAVFVPDFNVKNGQYIYPAADLSEQISTAGMEASGTGNMKFTMNGALTIGTLDGANVEIREAVGEENFFLFGLTAEQVEQTWAAGYSPRWFYEQDEDLRDAIDLINSGLFSHGDTGLFRPLTDKLLNSDPFLVCADFRDYVDCQVRAGLAYRDVEHWSRMSILNVARCGYFSSDRAIREYSAEIWHAPPLVRALKA